MAEKTLKKESDRMHKRIMDNLIQVGEIDDTNEAGIVDDIELNDYTTLMKTLEEFRILQYCIPAERQGEFQRIYCRLKKYSGSGQYIDRVRVLLAYWLHHCLSSHFDQCSDNSFDMCLPKRLIDLSQYGRNSRMVKITVDPDINTVYCALSYRWPRKHPMVLKRNNLKKLCEGVSADRLDHSIQDACEIVHALGIQYLWVDALCIIQPTDNDDADWCDQAPRMASIYGRALFTIALTDGTRLSKAAKDRPFLYDMNSSVPMRECSNAETRFKWLMESGNDDCRPAGELDFRGWTFQENFLSRRIVSLTKSGIYWDCLCEGASARRPVGVMGGVTPDKLRDIDNRRVRRLALTPKHGIMDPAAYQLWRSVVEEYTWRKFTRGSDRIIALSGFIERVEAALRDRYDLGIWNNDKLRCLAWSTRWPELGRREDIGTPSWSWKQISVPIDYRLRPGHLTHKIENKAKVERVETKCLGYNQFTGRLTITGAVLHIQIKGDHIRPPIYVQNTMTVWDFKPDRRPIEDGSYKTLLLMRYDTEAPDVGHALVLEPTGRAREFQRIGMFSFGEWMTCLDSARTCKVHRTTKEIQCLGHIQTIHII
ncbi:heterokaryon incompatibility protein-domain-containing protein [Aspergillus caelatus]|uniref:Heterokaryon incompatibility protein-domain-containing protein n=1 Tax=Aspergillus caelatus TaxID=61420 RepID=A0A5N7A1I7_9EURO|nr:heterokaryon incompatibility protein-domain-containing protein [Aspergillus caelatus]KAE8363413.1 heterokaryon incompatibility protein-domain-containing protein [Aspergillus caelatus]